MGGILGHSLCTGLAVVGGRIIAQKISVKTGKCFIYTNLKNYKFNEETLKFYLQLL